MMLCRLEIVPIELAIRLAFLVMSAEVVNAKIREIIESHG